MSTKDYEHLRDLFHELVDLSPKNRAAALNKLEISPEMLLELNGLLEEDVATGAFVETNMGVLGRQLVQSSEVADILPESIGDYRVIRKVGEGGMGIVFAAQRGEEDVVAIKVMRHALTGGEQSKRFHREGEVLSKLRHPGIATYLASGEATVSLGVVSRRLPYLAMEYVPGKPLLRFAQKAKLDDRGKLELIARVCDAAHCWLHDGIAQAMNRYNTNPKTTDADTTEP